MTDERFAAALDAYRDRLLNYEDSLNLHAELIALYEAKCRDYERMKQQRRDIADMLDAATDRAEAAERDAARYRWLLGNAEHMATSAFSWDTALGPEVSWGVEDRTLDAAIDRAAMAAGGSDADPS